MFNGRVCGAVLELILAAALWGFGFIATKWILGTFSAFELLFVRFLLASVIGLPWVLLTEHSLKFKLKLSFWPGVLLMGTLAFQTWGLESTTPTKSGFITTLYVVFVPLLEAMVARKKISAGMWACVAVALFGTALIVDVGFSQINFGDVLTFVSALIAAAQIYWMGTVSSRITRAFVFNLYQCFWCLVMCVPLLNYSEFWTKLSGFADWPSQVWIGFFTLAAGSTVIAFFLQVKAQKGLSRTVSSLLFLLESPFAMLFSIIFLAERLKTHEVVGAALIFAAAFFATWLESRPRRVVP